MGTPKQTVLRKRQPTGVSLKSGSLGIWSFCDPLCSTELHAYLMQCIIEYYRHDWSKPREMYDLHTCCTSYCCHFSVVLVSHSKARCPKGERWVGDVLSERLFLWHKDDLCYNGNVTDNACFFH